MDLEVIFRALWRRRAQLLLSCVFFAVLVPAVFTVAIPAKYQSSTQVQVYPPPDIDPSISASYPTDPDRYVATQVAAISSRASAAQVADQLKLDPTTVAKMTDVSQIAKSDAITVAATDKSADLAAKVASKMAANYVASSRQQTTQTYQKALQSVGTQLTSITDSIARLQTAATQTNNDPVLQSLQQQQADLTSKQQQLQSDLATAPDNTRVISNAAISKQATGTGKKTLAVYGAALGLGLAALVVTLSTTPGRSLEDLESMEEVQGIEVLGVLEPRHAGGRRNDLTDVHGLRIGSELRTIVKHKGQLTVVPIGRADRMAKACGVLVRLVEGQNARDEDEAGLVRADSFASFLELPEPENQRVVLAVDIEKITRRDLVDTLVTLGALGTEVMGLVGVR